MIVDVVVVVAVCGIDRIDGSSVGLMIAFRKSFVVVKVCELKIGWRCCGWQLP